MENIVKVVKAKKGKKRIVTTTAEFVMCEICGKKMKWIQNRHLEIHNMTLAEYRGLYPDSPTKTVSMQTKIDETRARKEEEPFHGRYCSAEGCNNPCRTAEKTYCSISCSSKTRSRIKGEENPFIVNGKWISYTDGSSASSVTNKKERAIYDGYCCKACGKAALDGKTRKYGVHHILPRALFALNEETYKVRDAKENLITLCNSCHKRTESRTRYFLIKKLVNGERFTNFSKLMEEIREQIESGFEIETINAALGGDYEKHM